MADRNRDPRDVRDARDARDFDRNRNSSRPGPDYEDFRREGFGEYPERSSRPRERPDFDDYGDYQAGSAGGPRRDYPNAQYPPYWLRDENPRQGFGGVSRPYTGEIDRGRFFGRGPKGYRRSDERIKEDISERLMTHPDIDASDIEVQVANGIVTLIGTVEDRHEKRIAEYIIEDAIGVDDVNNQLKVRHGFWASLTGEKASEKSSQKAREREVRREPTRDEIRASTEASRTNAARGAARRNNGPL